jgi:hypothetical protein
MDLSPSPWGRCRRQHPPFLSNLDTWPKQCHRFPKYHACQQGNRCQRPLRWISKKTTLPSKWSELVPFTQQECQHSGSIRMSRKAARLHKQPLSNVQGGRAGQGVGRTCGQGYADISNLEKEKTRIHLAESHSQIS